MRAAVYHEHGQPENVRVESFSDPAPGPHDVILRVKAASLNGFDPMILAKTTTLKTPLPMIPLGDCAGEIVALGSRAHEEDARRPSWFVTGFERHRWSIGDRVSPFPAVFGEGMTGETRLGTAAEYVRFPAFNLLPIPDELDDVAAAALPIAYGTAYRMVRVRARVRPKQTVLVWGASGGVGVATVALAKQAGATVIACASAGWKRERLRELGADHVIDPDADDVVARCREIAGKPQAFGDGGIDTVFNYVGGDTWPASLHVVRRHGKVVTCGGSAGHHVTQDLRYVWTYEQNVVGSNGWTPMDQLAVLGLAAQGRLMPVVHETRALEQTGEAIRDLRDRKVFGKLVIRV